MAKRCGPVQPRGRRLGRIGGALLDGLLRCCARGGRQGRRARVLRRPVDHVHVPIQRLPGSGLLAGRFCCLQRAGRICDSLASRAPGLFPDLGGAAHPAVRQEHLPDRLRGAEPRLRELVKPRGESVPGRGDRCAPHERAPGRPNPERTPVLLRLDRVLARPPHISTVRAATLAGATSRERSPRASTPFPLGGEASSGRSRPSRTRSRQTRPVSDTGLPATASPPAAPPLRGPLPKMGRSEPCRSCRRGSPRRRCSSAGSPAPGSL